MKAFGSFSWKKIRNWIAEAGMAHSGYHVDHGENSASRPALLPRRWFDQSRPGRETLPGGQQPRKHEKRDHR